MPDTVADLTRAHDDIAAAAAVLRDLHADDPYLNGYARALATALLGIDAQIETFRTLTLLKEQRS